MKKYYLPDLVDATSKISGEPKYICKKVIDSTAEAIKLLTQEPESSLQIRGLATFERYIRPARPFYNVGTGEMDVSREMTKVRIKPAEGFHNYNQD